MNTKKRQWKVHEERLKERNDIKWMFVVCAEQNEWKREENGGEGIWQTKTHVNWLFNPHNSWRAKAIEREGEKFISFFRQFQPHSRLNEKFFLFLFGHTNQDLSRRLWHQFDLTMISYFARIHMEQDKRDIWHINCSSVLPNIMLDH